MKAADYNIEIDRATTWEPVITYKDPSGVPVDLSGMTGLFEAQFPPSVRGGGEVVVSFNTENGGLSLGGALGTITPLVSDTAFSEVTASSGRYVLELFDGEKTVRLLRGKLTLRGRF